MKVIKRFFRGISLTASGLEMNILGSNHSGLLGGVNGIVRNIVIQQTSGSASTIDTLQIRYTSGVTELPNLIYSTTAVALAGSVSVAVSNVNGYFSLATPEPFDDIILFIEPNASGVFTIRVDIELY